jgi:hypothetical protein
MTPGQGCGCGCCGDRPCRGSSHWLGRDATPNQRHDTRVVWDALGMAGPLWLGLSGLHSACTRRDALHSAHGLRPWLPAIARPAPARAAKVWLVAWVASRLPITQARCPWPLDALSAAHSLVLHAPNAQPPSRNARHPNTTRSNQTFLIPAPHRNKVAWTCFLALQRRLASVPTCPVLHCLSHAA